MQWTPRGAHLLLQTRTKVLNEDLEETFRGWYPIFRHDAEGLVACPACPRKFTLSRLRRLLPPERPFACLRPKLHTPAAKATLHLVLEPEIISPSQF